MSRTVARLAIADPPYLGRGRAIYGDAPNKTFMAGRAANNAAADNHPDAAIWDDPQTHRELVERLMRDYDGWAIAMAHDNLRHYLQWVPENIWIAIWVKTGNAPPSGCRIRRGYEPVLVMPHPERRGHDGPGTVINGVLSAVAPGGFVGRKPASWTRWVLDMLGYDQDTDTVDDLFGGSGAVSREIAQQVMNP